MVLNDLGKKDTIMDAEKRKRLAAAGYVSVTVAEFLGLTQAQSDLIEIKLGFTYALRRQRTLSGLSQAELAEKIGSSQSRIAKMENGDPHVSLDLIIRALLAAGMTRGELAEVISATPVPSAAADDPKLPQAKRAGRWRTAEKKTSMPQAVEAGREKLS